ncbi:hypothetical protein [Desulfosporosinus sp. OT]|uniref:hypothetical protein n=1 Tax=Desulfosporosinus sp. OT TaxID=913865 RepID=UPI0002239EFA|nr:hypothetical protein [Desulfosporosinus sp. OT]EGW36631.1 hypothetical protein DOT_5496 [Desulfosporosinus sp. OT]
MHEGHHGILNETKKKNQGHNDHKSDHNHSQSSKKDNTTAIKIFAGIIVAIAIVGVLIWKMQS